MTRFVDDFVSVQGLYLPASLASGLTTPMLTIDDSTGEVTAIEAPSGGGGSAQRIVAGRVSSAGAVLAGSGFTATRNSTGDYTVTFSTAFSSSPICVATAGIGTSDTYVKHSNFDPTTGSFRVNTMDGSAGTVIDSKFDFIAIEV